MTSQSEKDERSDWAKRWKPILTIVNLCWANFAAWASFSLIAPFFPKEARLKDVPEPLIGFIFGVYELVCFLICPIFGLVIHRIGHKFMFVSGVFVCGVCSILFGLLGYCPRGAVFTAMCFLTRITEAFGAAAFLTACYTLAAKEFPNRITFIVGILETCTGVGLMTGPVIGGAFYDLGGFGLPFYVTGGVLLTTASLSVIILTEQSLNKEETEESVPIQKLICNVGFLIMILTIATSTFAWTFIDPTLADRLAPFRLSTTVVGLVFFIFPAIYAASSPFWGWLADKYNHSYLYLVLSNLAFGIGLIFLGPAPFLGLPFAVWLNAVSLCFLGFCGGCTMVMAYRGFIDISLQLGFEQNLATMGCISGIFTSSLALGAFLGPTFGSLLNANLGFDWACVTIAFIFLPVSLLSLIYFFILPKCCVVKAIQPDSPKNDTLSLLSASHKAHTIPRYMSESSTESSKDSVPYNIF